MHLVGLEPKSRSTERDRLIKLGLRGMRGIHTPLPIVVDGLVRGWAIGVRGSTDVLFRPMRPGERRWISAMDFDLIIKELTQNGNTWVNYWFKYPTSTFASTSWYDFWCTNGDPGGGTYTGTAKTLRQFDDTMVGCIQHLGNVSPSKKYLLYAHVSSPSSSVEFNFMLYDRVAAYDGCTVNNTLQTMTNALAAQRYVSAGQRGLQIMPNTITVMGANNAWSALTYVNQAGTLGQTIPAPGKIMTEATGPAAGTNQPAKCSTLSVDTSQTTAPFITLAQGDYGVRSITSYQHAAGTTGTFCYALVAPLAMCPTFATATAASFDFVKTMPAMERVYDGAHLAIAGQGFSGLAAMMNGSLKFFWTLAS
jgi:hypothetical protein